MTIKNISKKRKEQLKIRAEFDMLLELNKIFKVDETKKYDIYAAGNGKIYGKVKDSCIVRKIKLHDNGTGYLFVTINKKKRYVHRLVALAFGLIKDYHEKLDINHKDKNAKNCCIDNLEICSRLENIEHKRVSDLLHNNKTTSVEEIQKIKKEIDSDIISDIAEALNNDYSRAV